MRLSLRHPARIVPLAFLTAIAISTFLLMLPVCRSGGGWTPFMTALFTATSAICTAGMAVVDTATYWTVSGQVMIMVLTQLGGFGIMSLASLIGLLIARRLSLRGRLVTQMETGGIALGDIRGLLLRLAVIIASCESVMTLIVAARFWLGYDIPPGRALWYGLFHAVEAFNNGGFSLFSNSLIDYVGDWWINVPLALGVIVGGIGIPVLLELSQERRKPAYWSAHARLTVWGSAALLLVGFIAFLTFEWRNPDTFGPLSVEKKILAAFVQGTIPRTGGFNTIDFDKIHGSTLLITVMLMFIGGGSASTAGGIKVSTFFLLMFVIGTEVRGQPDVAVGRRRISESVQRQAITVALLGIAAVWIGMMLLLALTDGIPIRKVLFDSASAFGTVGLATGLSHTLSAPAQLVLIVLMFIGRVGVITTASAIALNTRRRRFHFPEERPIVG